ncbi:MAG TPA: E3 binding domain-containing protein [Rubrobacter sp.]|nr:E3 binding domain-containing protein [Rubrobacter sp.]
MSFRGAESQRGERPVRDDDGRSGRPGEYDARATEDRGESVGEPDVLLDVPVLKVEEIDLEVEDLRAKVSFQAELADLVKINVGLEAELGRVKLEIKGVEAQVQLKARLDNVRAIFSEVLGSLEHNPQFFRDTSGTDQTTDSSQEATRNALGAAETTEDAATDKADDREVEATNAAREQAGELGLDLSTLEGTGSGGRIILRDVQRAARG